MPQPVNRDAATLRWGIVTTVKAPLLQIARFSAYHLDLGVHRMHIHLDTPDPAIAARLAHPRIQFIQCDATYWQDRPDRTTSTHQMRQIYNASRVYRATSLDWLAHIDVDEFILAPGPLPDLLARVSADDTHVNLSPVEMMDTQGDPHHFKRYARASKRRVIYPTFGEYIKGGFLSTTSPKVFARTGLQNVSLGIHALRHFGNKVWSGASLPGLELGHAHAPDFETFRRHMTYRLDKGSYHNRKGKMNPIGLLIRTLLEDPDPDALRALHRELSSPTPDRLERLNDAGLLRTETLNLDAKVAQHFGTLEG
ncbi:glycosyltransferase family 2 protein [uncultured Tateyamaria sp.]|uniref:glycosyltransferase family 2 protein n=1 Tax=Tateyamaria sp. 1078 TaxID=3417464 RepID=UPI00262B1296|nr:glycosyltransferase family 2 protein [uncultured Tateyamaria sp.]